jgi:hypothetical protein
MVRIHAMVCVCLHLNGARSRLCSNGGCTDNPEWTGSGP